MKKFILAAVLAATAALAQAGGMAIWTGQMRQVQLVGGGVGYNCEYNYVGQTFWRAFRGFCPANVEVN